MRVHRRCVYERKNCLCGLLLELREADLLHLDDTLDSHTRASAVVDLFHGSFRLLELLQPLPHSGQLGYDFTIELLEILSRKLSRQVVLVSLFFREHRRSSPWFW